MDFTTLNNRELIRRLNATINRYAIECGCELYPPGKSLEMKCGEDGYEFTYSFILQPLIKRET